MQTHDLVVNEEETMVRCTLEVDVMDRYGVEAPIPVYAIGPFHENGDEASRLGFIAAAEDVW
ncbi:hypothetical protein ACP4OV_004985 [Aristida adscensionis]